MIIAAAVTLTAAKPMREARLTTAIIFPFLLIYISPFRIAGGAGVRRQPLHLLC